MYLCYQGTFAFAVIKYSPLKYNNEYEYPWWGNLIGWILALSSMLCTPLGVVVKLYHTPGTLREVGYIVHLLDMHPHQIMSFVSLIVECQHY